MDEESREFVAVLRSDPCAYCGARMEHVDHIEPFAQGGANEWTNLTAACQPCNHAKSDKSLLTFLGGR